MKNSFSRLGAIRLKWQKSKSKRKVFDLGINTSMIRVFNVNLVIFASINWKSNTKIVQRLSY